MRKGLFRVIQGVAAQGTSEASHIDQKAWCRLKCLWPRLIFPRAEFQSEKDEPGIVAGATVAAQIFRLHIFLGSVSKFSCRHEL